jgi:hypothetical protein
MIFFYGSVTAGSLARDDHKGVLPRHRFPDTAFLWGEQAP